MATIQEYNVKIRSLKNTQKITKTMKMVSASKLRKAQDAQSKAKAYAKKISGLVSRIASIEHPQPHALLKKYETVNRVLILIITSDKGLCGAFNHNANKMVASWIADNRTHHQQIDLCCAGRRGYMFFHKRDKVIRHYDDVTINPKFEDALVIGNDLSRLFQERQYDEIYISYNQFFSPLKQETVFEKILPIDPGAILEDKSVKTTEYTFEPTAETLLNFLIPHYLFFKIYFALLENSAGEHGARMSAMDNATKNATDLMERYTLLRNRARQAAITTELTEIVAGAEALN